MYAGNVHFERDLLKVIGCKMEGHFHHSHGYGYGYAFS